MMTDEELFESLTATLELACKNMGNDVPPACRKLRDMLRREIEMQLDRQQKRLDRLIALSPYLDKGDNKPTKKELGGVESERVRDLEQIG